MWRFNDQCLVIKEYYNVILIFQSSARMNRFYTCLPDKISGKRIRQLRMTCLLGRQKRQNKINCRLSHDISKRKC